MNWKQMRENVCGKVKEGKILVWLRNCISMVRVVFDELWLDLIPAVNNKRKKVEEKREWKMEIPSVEPYCFMAEECCMSELSSYISQQPVQEETTDKKLI